MKNRRELGFFSVVAMVIGTQLGSAIFLLPSQLAPYGIWSLLSWGLSGGGALALCQIFSVLAQHSTRMGGPHVYVDEAFGKRAAFYTGWSYWAISWISSLTVLLLTTSSIEYFVGDLGSLGRLGLQGTILFSIAALNLRGAMLSGVGEILFSILKVAPMILIPLFSIKHWKSDHLLTSVSELSPMASINAASLLTFWGFVGLEAGTTMTNCVKNAMTVVPRALFWGTIIVLGIYVLNTLAIMAVFPQEIIKTSPTLYGMLLTKMTGGAWCGKAISLLIFVMTLGTLNSWLLASGQIAMIAAREKLFPPFFGILNRSESPVVGIVITSVCLFIGMILLMSKSVHEQINALINFSTVLFILIYMMGALSLIQLMRTKKIPSSLFLWGCIAVGMVFCVGIIVTTNLTFLLGSMIVPLFGFVLSRVFRWPVR